MKDKKQSFPLLAFAVVVTVFLNTCVGYTLWHTREIFDYVAGFIK